MCFDTFNLFQRQQKIGIFIGYENDLCRRFGAGDHNCSNQSQFKN